MDWEGGNNKKEGKGRGNKMIPLEKQVTSLGPSRRLFHLKVKQDSLFYWWHDIDGWGVLYNPATIYREGGYSAFTSAEHGEALPDGFHSIKFNQKYRIEYNNDYIKAPTQADENEADSRAKMRIWLIENKLVEGK